MGGNGLGLAHRAGWTHAGFALTLAVVLALAVVALWTLEQHKLAAGWVTHTQDVRMELAHARSSLDDLQEIHAGRRLSSGEAAAQRFGAAAEAARARIAEVWRLSADNAGQQARLADLEHEFDALMARMQQDLQVHGDAAASAAPDFSQRSQGADVAASTQGLHERLTELDRVEQSLLDDRTIASDARLSGLSRALAALMAALLVLLALLYLNVRRWQRQEDRQLFAEQRFHVMTQNVLDYAILMLDPAGRISTWNAGAERMKGYGPDEIVGRHFGCLYLEEDRESGKPDEALRTAGSTGRYEDEGWRVRKDGSRFWANVVITAMRDAQGGLTGFAKITRDLTERRRADEALRTEVAETHRVEQQLHEMNRSLETLVAERTSDLSVANADLVDAKARLQELSGHLMETQENERRKISHELHDETGQALTTIKLRLAAGLRKGQLAPVGIEECIGVVDATIRQIRRLAIELRPLVLDDLGLADALEAALERFAESTGWTVSLNVGVLGQPLSSATETACFRIAQEALTNAARHAGANAVAVDLARVDGELVLTVHDDGCGFDPDSLRTAAMRRAHFGLVSMRERAALAGGRLDIASSPGDGTTIRTVFALDTAPEGRLSANPA